MTGRERRRWHPAGTDRNEAEKLAAYLATQASPTPGSAGLTVATFLLHLTGPNLGVVNLADGSRH